MTGIVSIDAATYHADLLGDQPTLSASIAKVGRPPRPAIDRFLEHVMPEPNSGCWIWLAGLDEDGYGRFFEGKGSGFERRAQRFAYKHYIGPIPQGMVIDHLCRVRACVNPAHLEPVTNAENLSRAVHSRALRTHCIRGHEFTEENTYRWRPGQGRICRKCHALTELQRWQKARAA
jgi:hypothetical protein